MEVPDRLLALKRSVEYGKEKKCGTIVVNLELLDLILRGEIPVGGNELPPEEVTKRLYEVKAKLQDEMYLRGNQLAAISSILMADTPVTLAATRIPKDHALYTPAFQDAVRTVEKVIALREQAERRAGKSPLRGMPLNDEGAIRFANTSDRPPPPIAREVAARVWQDQEMRNCVMDVEAAEAIARIVDGVRRNQADAQSYADLAASGGIVNAP